tara:strand:+ start:166 stop:360 length:195 start_codon:yes stop_codon:yes gene_type:complete
MEMKKKKFNKNQLNGVINESDLDHDKGYCVKDSTENMENDPKGARIKGYDHTGFLDRGYFANER